MPHVDDARLHAYLDGELRWLGEDPERIEGHLAGCVVCRARLEEAKRLRELGRSLLGADLPVEPPPFEVVLRRARGAAEAPPVRRRVPAAVWAASVVLAVAGGWIGRGILGGDREGSAGEAMQVASARVPADTPATVSAPPAAAPSGVSQPEPAAAEASVRRRDPSELAVVIPPAAADANGLPAAAPLAPPQATQAPIEANPSAEPFAGVHESRNDEGPARAPRTTSVAQLAQVAPDAARPPAATGEEEDGVARIEGRVTDESGRVIPGAVIRLRGRNVGTLTGPDGTYSLALPAQETGSEEDLLITAAALGWEAVTQPLGPTGDQAVTRDFQLRPAQVALEALVAVGYGTARAPTVGGEIGEAPAGEPVEEAWAPATREEVRRLLGRDALLIRGAPVQETSIGWVDGIRTVRVRQELPGGVIATLLQAPEPRRGGAVPAVAAGAGRAPTLRSAPGAEPEATMRREGVRVVVHAPLAAEALEALLERIE